MARVLRGSGRRVGSGWVGAVGTVVAVVAVAAVPVSADQAMAVGLSLSSGSESPRVGEEVDFRATVANSGSEPVDGALLAQHVPEGLEILEVEDAGVAEEGIANWRVDVPAGGEAVYTVRTRITEEAVEGERLLSTACLLLDREADPAACASDSVRVADVTVMSRIGGLVDRNEVVRMAGAGLVLVLVWLLWRRRGALGGG